MDGSDEGVVVRLSYTVLDKKKRKKDLKEKKTKTNKTKARGRGGGSTEARTYMTAKYLYPMGKAIVLIQPSTARARAAHARTHLPTSARPLLCAEVGCEKRFWTQQHLNAHVEVIHRGLKGYEVRVSLSLSLLLCLIALFTISSFYTKIGTRPFISVRYALPPLQSTTNFAHTLQPNTHLPAVSHICARTAGAQSRLRPHRNYVRTRRYTMVSRHRVIPLLEPRTKF